MQNYTRDLDTALAAFALETGLARRFGFEWAYRPASKGRVIAGFRGCFHDRASESDPTAIPASCRRASSDAGPDVIRRAVGAATIGAREDDFTSSVGTAWFYDVGVFGLTFLLVFLLPPLDRRALKGAAAAAP